MINNRQGNRRRGRNNNAPRQNNNNRGGGDQANRIDSRARGNAAQLLEKYKNMARDAQTQSDRVLTEYYLQFADHYFRVLADARIRQEEQQAERRARHEERTPNWRDEQESMEIEGVEHGVEGEPVGNPNSGNTNSDEIDADGEEAFARQPRRDTRREDNRRDDNRGEQDNRPRPARTERPVRTRSPRNDEARDYAPRRRDDEAQLDASLLPPSIAPANDLPGEDADAVAPKPRRGRPRKVSSESADAAE